MSEYIERGAVLEEIEDMISNTAFSFPYQNEINIMVDGMERARNCVENALAADVVEVKHGEWGVGYYNDANDFVLDCSACGQPNDFLTNYCPNCGAKMDGE